MNNSFPGTGASVSLSNRLVVFMPFSGRWLALCFGYGDSALDGDVIAGLELPQFSGTRTLGKTKVVV